MNVLTLLLIRTQHTIFLDGMIYEVGLIRQLNGLE